MTGYKSENWRRRRVKLSEQRSGEIFFSSTLLSEFLQELPIDFFAIFIQLRRDREAHGADAFP